MPGEHRFLILMQQIPRDASSAIEGDTSDCRPSIHLRLTGGSQRDGRHCLANVHGAQTMPGLILYIYIYIYI